MTSRWPQVQGCIAGRRIPNQAIERRLKAAKKTRSLMCTMTFFPWTQNEAAPEPFGSGAETQEALAARSSVAHALALSLSRGCVLPDATLRGEAEFRPHDGAVSTVSDQDFE